MAHCSVIGMSVAPSPPCSAIHFCKAISPRLGEQIFLRFFFGPPDFSRILSPDFFLLIFVGKKCPENPPGKSPAKFSKIYTTKIPNTYLQKGQSQDLKQILKVKNCKIQTAIRTAFGLAVLNRVI